MRSMLQPSKRLRRSVVLGISILSVVSAVAFSIHAIGPATWAWLAGYDHTSYARITQAIAIDPQHLCGRQLYDVSRELGLEDVPWDDGNVQNEPGSFRIYHFRGFAVYVTLDYTRSGVTRNILLERGSTEEKVLGRDLLRIHPTIAPFARIDGICGREERMRQYWARVDEDITQTNDEQMKSQRQSPKQN